MSTTVDQKIVQMKFDNSNFEHNVKQSMSTLDKLKAALSFDKSKKALDDLNTSANNIDFSKMEYSSYKAGFHFQDIWLKASSVFEYQVANRIVSAAERITKSLTFDQITAGWDKFESKTQSVQTIMSATNESWKKNADAVGFVGSQMEFVSEQLDKLNWFSDETSYSFKDMTDNIGKFTAAGVGLTTSVEAMEGISLWAARSGQKTQEAARAMYNLSQALGTGSVKLIDWKSIENANMATQEFKQTAIQTAEELGTLKKVEDGVWKTLKGHEVTVTNFNEALKDQWFNSKVLITTLREYGKAATLLNAVSSKYDVTATQTLSVLDDYVEGLENGKEKTELLAEASKELGINSSDLEKIFDALASEEYKLSLASFKAGQECKTFGDVVEATADAVSTSWMNIFESIFGNYEQAKELWTDLCEEFYDVFVGDLAQMNTAFSKWSKELGGRDDLFGDGGAFWNIIEGIKSIVGPFNDVIEELFPSLKLLRTDVDGFAENIKKATEKFKDFTEKFKLSEEAAESLRKVLKVLSIPLKAIIELIKIGGSLIGPVIQLLFLFIQGLFKVGESIGKLVIKFISLVGQTEEFKSICNSLVKIKNNIINFFKDIWNKIRGLNKDLPNVSKGFETFLQILFKITKISLGVIAKVLEAIANLSLSGITDSIKKFNDRLTEMASKSKVLSAIVTGFKTFVGVITGIGSGIGEFFKTLISGFKDVETFDDFLKLLGDSFKALGEKIAETFGFIDLTNLSDGFETVKTKFKDFVEAFTSKLKDVNWARVVVIAFAIAVSAAVLKLADALTSIASIATTFNNVINTINTSVKKLLGINSRLKEIKEIGIFIGILAASLYALSTIPADDLTRVAITFGILSSVLLGFAVAMAVLQKNSLFFADNMVKSVLGIAALAGSMGLLVLSLKAIEDLNLGSWDTMWKKLIYIVGAMVGFAAAIAIVSRLGDKFKTGAVSILAMAGAIAILANGVSKIASVEFVNVEDTVSFILGLCTGLAVVEMAAKKVNLKSILLIAAIGFAFKEIIPSLSEAINAFSQIQLSDDAKMIIEKVKQLAIIVGSIIGLVSIVTTLKSIFGKFKVVKSIGKTAKSFVDGLMELALAIGILSLEVVYIYNALEKLNGEKVGRIAAATAVVVALMAFTKLLSGVKLNGGASGKDTKSSLKEFAKSLTMIGVATLAMVLAIDYISELGKKNPGSLVLASVIVAALIGFVTKLTEASRYAKEVKAAPFIGMSIALATIVASIMLLSSYLGSDNGPGILSLLGSIALIGGALLAICISLEYVSKHIESVKTAPIIAMTVALGVIIAGLMILTKFAGDAGIILTAALSLSMVLVAIGGALAIANKYENGVGPLIAMTAALAIAAAGLYAIALNPWNQILVAGIALSATILSIGGALAIANKYENGVGPLIAMTAALAIAAAGLYAIALNPWNQILVAGIALSATILSIGGALAIASKNQSGIAALLAMAAMVGVVSLSLLALTLVPWQDLLIATGILAGFIAVITLIGGVFGEVAAPGIFALAASFGALGLSLITILAPIALVIGVVDLFIIAIDAFILILMKFLGDASTYANGIITIASAIANGITTINASISNGIIVIASAISSGMIIIATSVNSGIMMVALGIDSGINFIIGNLAGYGLKLGAAAREMIANFISAFTGAAGIVDKVKQAASDCVNGFKNTITSAFPTLKSLGEKFAGKKGGGGFLGGLSKAAGWSSPWDTMIAAAKDCVAGFSNGLEYDKVKSMGKQFGSDFLGSFDLGGIAEIGQLAGLDLTNGFKNGTSGLLDYIKSIFNLGSTFKSFSESGANGMPSDIAAKMDAAKKNTDGLLKSVEDLIPAADDGSDAMNGLGDSTEKAGKSAKETQTDFEKLADTIRNSISPFEEFNKETDLTAEKLLNNMKSQIEGAAEYTKIMMDLGRRGMSQDLYSKIMNMGVSEGYKYAKAFQQMTDEQLAYANVYYKTINDMPEMAATQLYAGYYQSGQWMMEGFTNGITADAAKAKVTLTGKQVLDAFQMALDEHSPSKATELMGRNLDAGLGNGIGNSNSQNEIKYKAQSLCSNILNIFRTELAVNKFKLIGNQIVTGLTRGINESASSAINAAKSLASSLPEWVRKVLDINSPSKVTEGIGKFFDLGLAKGIKNNTTPVIDSVESVSKEAVDMLKGAISNIDNIDDSQPVIRPVFDLTDIQNGSKTIDSILGSNMLNINGSMYGLNNLKYLSGAEINNTSSNKDVVDAVKSLKEDVIGLKQSISNIKMVLDSGTLVGEMVAPMDAALGQKAVYAGRGN